ncbi:MAG TPA: hypothetical protein VGM92_01750 [Candidatus Kapabacteria bacterium]
MERITSRERMLSAVIAAMIVLVLVMQAWSLYEFPQPDSSRWWGDETGQMLELRTELTDGYARIPTALGSSVAITNGIVRGNSWMAAVIYGVPALIFSSVADLVGIGRTVTFLLSLLLFFAMYRMLVSFNVSRLLALVGMLLLISTRSFFFASHAARLDVAASITVVGFAWYFTKRFGKIQQGTWNPSLQWYFYVGAGLIVFATLSIHLLTLLPLLTFFALWKFQAHRRPIRIVVCGAGALTALSILVGIYYLSGAPFTIFGSTSGMNQFHTVASNLPILRPFSRSVQVANILERVHGIRNEAPAFLALAFVAIIVVFVSRRTSRSNTSAPSAFINGSAMIVLIAWLFFQSPALYYYVHVLPIFIVAMTIAISRRWNLNVSMLAITLLISVALCFVAVKDSVHARESAERIANDNGLALEASLRAIHSEKNSGTPLVLAQNPAIAILEHDARVRLMTAHLISFPISNAPLADRLRALKVQYLLLYASHDGSSYSDDYHALRPFADSLGTVMVKSVGILFDVHRDYFNPQTFTCTPDTLILYKLPFATQ